MPIRTGTRLERLESLQRRTQHEKASAVRRGESFAVARLDRLDKKLTAAIKAERRAIHGNRVDQELKARGVTAKTVRAWALKHGLTTAQRGRLGAELVEAYINHHQN